MKRLSIAVLAGVLGVALVGCAGMSGGSQGGEVVVGDSTAQGGQQVVVSETPEEILGVMQGDFNDTAQKLYDKQAELFEAVGALLRATTPTSTRSKSGMS